MADYFGITFLQDSEWLVEQHLDICNRLAPVQECKNNKKPVIKPVSG
jgi:hypothetical protein